MIECLVDTIEGEEEEEMNAIKMVRELTITEIANGTTISEAGYAALEIAKTLGLQLYEVKFIHNDRRYSVSLNIQCEPNEHYPVPPFTPRQMEVE